MSFKTNFENIDLNKYYYDAETADKVVRYIEQNIRHVAGPLAGQPLILEDWQKNEIIKPIFGWKHIDTGLRKYTSAYIEIPKKNGKTFLAAAFAAIFLDIENEKGEVPIFSIAGNNDQARLTFKATKGIIAQSRRLSKKAEMLTHSITVKTKDSHKYFRALASKSETQQGVNPQLVIADEVHIHKDADLIENQRKSMIARKQPLFLMITTAGSDLYGVGYQEHTYAREVAEEIRKDESLLVCIYCADKDDDPLSENTWKEANPNYGISVTKEGLEKEANKATYSKASLNSFLRYHLNIWTQSKDSWMDDQVWKQCYWQIDEDELLGKPCYGGLDLSAVSDITAFTLVFQTPKGYVSKNWYFLPEIKGRDSADKNNMMYYDWVEDGKIIETPGNAIDYDFIVELILELGEKYEILNVAYDPHKAQQVIPRIYEGGQEMVAFNQGWKQMTGPITEFERLIIEKQYNHLNDPVLRWMAGNTQKYVGAANNFRLEKDKLHPEKKIDGIITNTMALALWIKPEEKSGTYLNDGELTIL